MRDKFLQWLDKKAEKDDKIVLIVGDMGFGHVPFEKPYVVNCGITEQSFMGMAAGMAIEGMKPYVYSCIPFVCMRNYEQLRNDICYQNRNVKIIGVRGSVHYKFLGPSHNISEDEDIKILFHLPNLKINIPNESNFIKSLERSYKEEGPVYFRI